MSNAAADPRDGQVLEVLVVDDNPATRYATSRVLRAAGFKTREASTGEQALDLADNTLSAVILDVNLPDIDGFEVCRQMRGRDATARLPVIHLSATYVNDRDKVRGLDSGADAYVTHPADPTLLVATVRALVRARVAEEALRRSEVRFRAIYDEAPSGICLIDADGRFIDANNAMLALLRRERQAVLGRQVVEFAPPEQAERMARYLGRGTKGLSRASFPLLDSTGRAVDLEWSLSTHVEPGLSIATVTDVSELANLARQREELLEREQAARATAERASRAKDELIAVLSHELRTPLNAILGWVHVLKRQQPGPMGRALEGIERGARAQARLVSDILDVSRLDLGKLRLNIETINAVDLVQSALADCRDAINEKAITVSIAGGASRPLRADPERLRQVLWNLLSNATKFSEHGGHIWIELQPGEAGLSLRVRDEGLGIDPQFLPHVFERFTQSDSGSNRFHGGLGLGMSIVAHLVELHGGTVNVHSEGVGRGATFTLTLPWSPLNAGPDGEPAAAALPPPGPSQPERHDGGEDAASGSLAGLTVLAVEDDPEAREMLSMILRERGARVLSVESCEGALRVLQGERPDVLISDIGMPGQDGYDLVRRIRAQEQAAAGGRLPAIALTAFAREKDRQLALASGFDAHCAKPLRPHELIELVLRVTSAPAAPVTPA